MIKLKDLLLEKKLRVFDFDDTLVKSNSKVYVNNNGAKTTLSPGQFAVYKKKSGDEFDFKDFNRMLNKPQVIKKNFQLLQRMLKNPQKKVTILTARKLGFPIRKFFKDEYGMDVYPVALASNNPKDKADWIEKHIAKGYTDIAFMDDSIKNVKAVGALQKKYPNITIKSVLAVEHLSVDETRELIENYIEDNSASLL
jgi:hypothetical protein